MNAMLTPALVGAWALASVLVLLAIRALVLVLETTWTTMLNVRKVAEWRRAWERSRPEAKWPPDPTDDWDDEDDNDDNDGKLASA